MAPGHAPTQTVGPDFKSLDEKPTATVSSEVGYDNVRVLPQTPQLIALLSYVTTTFQSLQCDTQNV